MCMKGERRVEKLSYDCSTHFILPWIILCTGNVSFNLAAEFHTKGKAQTYTCSVADYADTNCNNIKVKC